MSTTTWDQIDHDPTSIASDRASSDEVQEEAADDFYADWHAEIDQHRIALLAALNTALAALDEASRAWAELTSNQLYDIEFAETRTGEDVGAFLDDSSRYTRAAYAITHRITERG